MNMDLELKPPEKERIHKWNLPFSKAQLTFALTHPTK